MKKQFKLDEIDCANCARELQDELAKLEGVKSVSVSECSYIQRGGLNHGSRRSHKEKEEAQEERVP